MKELLLFLKKHKLEYFEQQPIKPHLSIKIGGKVKIVIKVKRSEILRELVIEYLQNRYPFVLLGGGSNVVFSDEFSDVVVVINRTAEIGEFNNNRFRANSGVSNRDLLNWCKKHQVSGLEFLAGIPGTIGGAAAVNAGAFGQSISESLDKAEIINAEGELATVGPDYFQFSYRDSIFKTGNQVILNMVLYGRPEKKSIIQKRIAAYLEYRRQNHPPYSSSTAGCFFKNPRIKNQRVSAGKIIENTGLKGVTLEHVAVSENHANFIVNRGQGSFKEILDLEKKITSAVFQQQGIRLQREVIYISPEGKKY